MKKYTPYESPAAFLARKFVFIRYLRALYFKYNQFDEELKRPGVKRGKHSYYFLGGLNPLLAIAKDVVDTFKPYKSSYYVQRDFLQPLRGLGNIIRGVFNIIVTPLIYLVNVGRYSISAIRQKSFELFIDNMSLGSLKAGGGFLEGICNIVRGVTQLISTPLTWLLRIPFRGLITLIKGKPTLSQNLEQRIEILTGLIKKEGKTVADTLFIDNEMQSIEAKVIKAGARRQEIGADPQKITQGFRPYQKFTEKQLTLRGSLTQCYGIASEDNYEYYSVDSEDTRVNALNFLGLFKTKGVTHDVMTQDPSFVLSSR